MRSQAKPRALRRRSRLGLCAAAVIVAACTDQSSPTEALRETHVIALAVTAQPIEQARASVEDVVARILPSLDNAGGSPGLRVAADKLLHALGSENPAAVRAELTRTHAAVDGLSVAATSSVASELDAIRLALGAVERAVGSESRP